jgi:hypothetical protein
MSDVLPALHVKRHPGYVRDTNQIWYGSRLTMGPTDLGGEGY